MCGKLVIRIGRHLKTHELEGDDYKEELRRHKRPYGVTVEEGQPVDSIGYEENLLSRFKTFLTSMGGYNASEKQTSALVGQLRKIFAEMSRASGAVCL